MHIPPFDNHNKPIIDAEDSRTPLTYFNIVKLAKGQAFTYRTPGYETCIGPATGKIGPGRNHRDHRQQSQPLDVA